MSECKRCLQLEDELFQLKDDLGLHDDENISKLVSIFKLTPHEVTYLIALYYSKERVLSKEFLFNSCLVKRHIKGQISDFNIKVVDVLVCRIRSKLPNKSYIETIWGRGYKLTHDGWEYITSRLNNEVINVPTRNIGTRMYDPKISTEYPSKIRYRGKLYQLIESNDE